MYKRFKLFFLFTFILFTYGFSQADAGWRPVALTLNGKNIQNGVEVFFLTSVDKHNDNVLFLKFINHNNSPIVVEWNDAVLTKDLKWAHNSKLKNETKSVKIKANETINGMVAASEYPDMVIKLKDFIDDVSSFKSYGMSSLKVNFNK